MVKTGDSDVAKSYHGKRVAFFAPSDSLGTWGEYVICDQNSAFIAPDNLSYEEAANCLVNPLTVQGMIETCLRDGQKAIVHAAAASALGKMLVNACKQAGITLINIVRRQEQVKIL